MGKTLRRRQLIIPLNSTTISSEKMVNISFEVIYYLGAKSLRFELENEAKLYYLSLNFWDSFWEMKRSLWLGLKVRVLLLYKLELMASFPFLLASKVVETLVCYYCINPRALLELNLRPCILFLLNPKPLQKSFFSFLRSSWAYFIRVDTEANR